MGPRQTSRQGTSRQGTHCGSRCWVALLLTLAVGCEGTISEVGDGPPPPVRPPPFEIPDDGEPDVAWAPSALLTSAQYGHAVFDLLGVRPSAALPSENQTDTFVNNAYTHEATLLSEDVRADIARDLASTIDGALLIERVGCDVDCDVARLAPFLRRAFRRDVPLEEREALAALVSSGDDALDGLRLLVEVVLLSPQFLYRFEAPAGPPGPEGYSEADGFTVASRLSFFLWSSGPDDELLDLAESGALLEPSTVASQVERLMDDPRFERTVESFHEQWLELHPIEGLERTGEGLEDFAAVGPSWRRSFDAFVLQTFDRGLSELLTTSDLVLSADLAPLYGFEAPEGSAPGDLAVYSFDPAERAGLLTHPALLAKLAYADQDSPIFRGVFVMEQLLCKHPPPPPMNIDLTPPPVDPESTSRERFQALTGGDPCNTCHRQFNPIGYLFSHFDAAGRYVDTSASGRDLDSSATLLALGDEIDGSYEGASDFAQALGESDAVRDCVAGHWLRYALGRPLSAEDARSAHDARADFRDASGDFRALMGSIASGPGFRFYRAEGERR